MQKVLNRSNEIPNQHSQAGHEVHELCHAIEQLFTQHCGAIARQLIPEARKSWVLQYQPRLGTLKKYIDMLADLIPERKLRKSFKSAAGRRLISRS